jgi:hypothetical protein
MQLEMGRDVVSIAKMSLGVTTLTTEAGSFGGYVRTVSDNTFGVSATHVTPGSINEEVSCPSTVELTERLRNNIPYTSSNPRPSRFHRFRDRSDREARHMISTYRITDDPDNGIELVDHEGKKILSGHRLGGICGKGISLRGGHICQTQPVFEPSRAEIFRAVRGRGSHHPLKKRLGNVHG